MSSSSEKDFRAVRFGDYLRAVNLETHRVRLSDLAAMAPRSEKLEVRSLDVFRILQPYLSVRAREQARAVLPLAGYLALFQWSVLRSTIAEAGTIFVGLLAVMGGLLLFMEGLKLGLMPFGEMIGHALPKRVSLGWVLVVAFALGVGVTFAEPAIGALQVAGALIDPRQAPYLASLLRDRSFLMVLMVGGGVGLATVLGTLRFLFGWSLKPLIYLAVIPTLILTGMAAMNPQLVKIIGLAWDCGGVTTGPVTVPLVLSLGLGVAASGGRGSTSLSGFGIVTLASLFPVTGVLLLGLGVAWFHSPESVADALVAAQAAAQAVTASATEKSFFSQSPGQEIYAGVQAVIPLVIFLLFILRVVLREKLPKLAEMGLGIVFTTAGMILFTLGLNFGLAKLGEQSGALVPGAFTPIPAIAGSPLYGPALGILIAGIFAWVLGFGSTLAEPALNALGITVENLTQGVFRRRSLIFTISAGVATGISLGLLKLVFGFSILWILIPAYGLALLLTHFSTEELVNFAWDGAAVTTGPVTVPLVLALGLGVARVLGQMEGFGMLASASIFPVIFVLTQGLWLDWRARRETAIDEGERFVESSVPLNASEAEGVA